jgi:glycosyltransferase involved in cell wall biosynthesis
VQRILNIMLSARKGGIEQAAVDYAEALAHAGIDCLTVVAPDAWCEGLLKAANLSVASFKQWGDFDPFAPGRLRALARQFRATHVICHGKRALRLAARGLKGRATIVAVTHNYTVDAFHLADQAFAITTDLAQALAATGFPQASIHAMPNLVRVPAGTERQHWHNPPVIGAMGRLIEKKGFDVLIAALAILRQRGIAFRAIIGGDGASREQLVQACATAGLQDCLQFAGWVDDRKGFFDQIDIFALPSRHEPFGIVLLEAMAVALPCVATASEGPAAILSAPEASGAGVLVANGDAVALADGLAGLLADAGSARIIGEKAQELVRAVYDLPVAAGRLASALKAMPTVQASY